MLFAAVLVNTDHAALENTEEAFHCVRGHVATGVLLHAVVDRFMAGKLLTECRIDGPDKLALSVPTC